ncbi:MAG: hypothetical protein HFACDABA_00687 [Anaerolineales bacterium]|nr:hypothetical protein [Anaerolineales bacterium]
MKRLTLIFLLALTLTSCRFAPRVDTSLLSPPQAASPSPTASPAIASPVPHSIEPIFDIRYSDEQTDDPRRLSLDIYPTSQQNAPVMIYVHGGGWTRGNRSNVDAKPAAFNQHGFVFVSVDYRLIPDVDIAEQVGDIAAAIAWTKDNIAQYGGDPTRIFLMGHSAGAHLVSLVATDPSYLEAEAMSLADIHGVISLDTQAYDINTLMENASARTSRTYINAFTDDPQMWTHFSPITYVEPGQSLPPFFLVYSGEAPGRKLLTEHFAQALEEAGVSSFIQPATEKNHGQVNEHFGVSGEPMSDAAFEWLMEILGQI